MSFPPSFLEELRTRLPLSSFVGKRMRLVRAGREYKGCCPFHNEKTPSFYINDDKQFFHCFGCGAHGDVIGFAMRYDHQSFPEAIEALAAQAGLAVPEDTPVERERYDKEKRLLLLLEAATLWFEEQLRAPCGSEARAYLANRGLGPETIARFRLGYAPGDGKALLAALAAKGFNHDEMLAVGLAKRNEERGDIYSFFRNRVLFPVGDRRGQTVAFGGRVMGEGEPKYLNSPDHPLFHKGRLLYGLSRARSASAAGQPLIVVEGYMDVIALVEAGFTGALAPLGTALTEDQLGALWALLPPEASRDPSRDTSPILCFDGDNAGLRASERAVTRALPLLTPAQTIRVAYLPSGEDPDSLIRQNGKAAMQAVLDEAKPLIDVLWQQALEGRILKTPEDRARLMGALKRRITPIGHETLRQLYRDELKNRMDALWASRAPAAGNRQPFQNTYGGPSRQGAKGTFRPVMFSHVKSPDNPVIWREKILLALLLNHPDLFADFGEDLVRISFSLPPLEALRQQLVTILSAETQELLDAQALYRHLSQGSGLGNRSLGPEGVLSDVLSEATYMRASFARPEKSSSQARQGWKAIWNKHLQEQLQADLEAARRHHAADSSDANLARLMALRAQLAELMNESPPLLEPDEVAP